MEGATLAVKVYESTTDEKGAWTRLIGFSLPDGAIGDGADPEHDHSHEWAFLFGVAYAVARLENPLRSELWLQAQAEEAATKSLRWHTTGGGRPRVES